MRMMRSGKEPVQTKTRKETPEKDARKGTQDRSLHPVQEWGFTSSHPPTMSAPFGLTCLSPLTPVRLACLLALFFAAPLASSAQEFPSRAIKLVVPFPAGGPADTFGRVLADKMGAL